MFHAKIPRFKTLLYSGFFEGENFQEFHESIAFCENFTLEIFSTLTALPQ